MSSSASRSRSAAHGSIRPYFGRSEGGAARNRFSATLRPITSVIVWYAMPRPRSMAALAEAVVSGSPAISTTPSSGTTVPLAMPSKVDLPEPFSPRTAWISPARTSSDTLLLAWTGPYRLETPRSERTVGAPPLWPIADTLVSMFSSESSRSPCRPTNVKSGPFRSFTPAPSDPSRRVRRRPTTTSIVDVPATRGTSSTAAPAGRGSTAHRRAGCRCGRTRR